MPDVPKVKLSICIPTFNRSSFIGDTLDSILAQMTDDCEIVISDNASTDDTERVVMAIARKSSRLRYFKQGENIGVEKNFDRVIHLARGEFCWLFSDDDILKPGAVSAVVRAVADDPSLVVVNVETRDFSMSRILRRRWLDVECDLTFSNHEMDRLFSFLDETLWYIGSVVFKRDIWITSDINKYYGSLFLHVAVLYQKPLPGNARVISTPLIIYRMGNAHAWGAGVSEVLLAKWPSLVESLAVSPSARRLVRSAEPWRRPGWLLHLRGTGIYSISEYRRWIAPRIDSFQRKLAPIIVALLPAHVANAICVVHCLFSQHRHKDLCRIKISRYYFLNWLTKAS